MDFFPGLNSDSSWSDSDDSGDYAWRQMAGTSNIYEVPPESDGPCKLMKFKAEEIIFSQHVYDINGTADQQIPTLYATNHHPTIEDGRIAYIKKDDNDGGQTNEEIQRNDRILIPFIKPDGVTGTADDYVHISYIRIDVSGNEDTAPGYIYDAQSNFFGKSSNVGRLIPASVDAHYGGDNDANLSRRTQSRWARTIWNTISDPGVYSMDNFQPANDYSIDTDKHLNWFRKKWDELGHGGSGINVTSTFQTNAEKNDGSFWTTWYALATEIVVPFDFTKYAVYKVPVQNSEGRIKKLVNGEPDLPSYFEDGETKFIRNVMNKDAWWVDGPGVCVADVSPDLSYMDRHSPIWFQVSGDAQVFCLGENYTDFNDVDRQFININSTVHPIQTQMRLDSVAQARYLAFQRNSNKVTIISHVYFIGSATNPPPGGIAVGTPLRDFVRTWTPGASGNDL